jgi:hypothetical protein
MAGLPALSLILSDKSAPLNLNIGNILRVKTHPRIREIKMSFANTSEKRRNMKVDFN